MDDKYCVYYHKHNDYIAIPLSLAIIGIIEILLLLFSEDTPKVFLTIILLCLVMAVIYMRRLMKKGKKENAILIWIDRNGILDCHPMFSKGFYRWDEIKDVGLHYELTGHWIVPAKKPYIELTLKENDKKQQNRKVLINLTGSTDSLENVFRMIGKYRYLHSFDES